MIRFVQIAVAAGALIAAMPAQAADYIVNTAVGQKNGDAAGNTFYYTVASTDGKSTVKAKATAWSRDASGNYSAGQLASWGSDGLGIYQAGQNESTRGAYHQVDNVDGWEFVVLQFDQVVSLQSAVLKSFQLGDRDYVDSDAFVAWGAANYNSAMSNTTLKNLEASLKYDWTKQSGATWFNSNGDNYASTTSGWSGNGSLVQTQTQTYNLSPSQAGSVWIIGGSFNGPDWRNDAFKLNTIKVSSGVPEPTTWMMMILGFGLVGAAVRRRGGAAKPNLA